MLDEYQPFSDGLQGAFISWLLDEVGGSVHGLSGMDFFFGGGVFPNGLHQFDIQFWWRSTHNCSSRLPK